MSDEREVFDVDDALRIFDKFHKIAIELSNNSSNFPVGTSNFDIKMVVEELTKIQNYIENVVKQNAFINEDVLNLLEIIKTTAAALRSELTNISNIQIPLVIMPEQLDNLLRSFGFTYLSLPINTKKLILEELVANYKIKGTLNSVENIVRKFVPNVYIVELYFSREYEDPKFVGKRVVNVGGNVDQLVKYEFEANHTDSDKYWHLTDEEMKKWPVKYAMSPYFVLTYSVNLTLNLLAAALLRHRAKLDYEKLPSDPNDEQAWQDYRNTRGLTIQTLPEPFNYLELYLMIRYVWMKFINLYVADSNTAVNTYGYFDDNASTQVIIDDFNEHFQTRRDDEFSCIKTYRPSLTYATEDCDITTTYVTGNGKVQERLIEDLDGSGFAICGNNLVVIGGRNKRTGEPNNIIRMYDIYFQSSLEVSAEVNLYRPVLMFCGCENVLVFGGYKMKVPQDYIDDLYDTTDIYDKLIENYDMYIFSLKDFTWNYAGKIPREMWMSDPHVLSRSHQYLYTISRDYQDPLPGAIYRINILTNTKFLLAIIDPETYDVASSQVVIDDQERLWIIVKSRKSLAQRLLLLDPLNDVFIDFTQLFLYNMPDWQRFQVQEALESNKCILVSIGNDPSIFWTHNNVTYSYQLYVEYEKDKLKDVIRPVKLGGPLIPSRRCYICGPYIVDFLQLLYDTRVKYDTEEPLPEMFDIDCDVRNMCENLVRRFKIEEIKMCVTPCDITEQQRRGLVGPETLTDDLIRSLPDVFIVPTKILEYVCSHYDTNKFYDLLTATFSGITQVHMSALTLKVFDPIKVRVYQNFYLGFSKIVNDYQSLLYNVRFANTCFSFQQELYKLTEDPRVLNLHKMQLVREYLNTAPIKIVCIDKLPEVMETVENIYKDSPLKEVVLQWMQNKDKQNYNIFNLLYVLSQFDGTLQYDRDPEMLFNLEPRYQCVYMTALMCYGIIPKLHCSNNAKIVSSGNNIGFLMLECHEGTYLNTLERYKELKKFKIIRQDPEYINYTCDEPCQGCMGAHWEPRLSARCVRENMLKERTHHFVLDHDPLPKPSNRDELRDLLMQLVPNNVEEIDTSLSLGTIFLELLDIVNSLVPGADVGLLTPDKYKITMDLVNLFKPYYARPLQSGISTSILDPIGNWVAMGDCLFKELFQRLFMSVYINECIRFRDIMKNIEKLPIHDDQLLKVKFPVIDNIVISDDKTFNITYKERNNLVLHDDSYISRITMTIDQNLNLIAIINSNISNALNDYLNMSDDRLINITQTYEEKVLRQRLLELQHSLKVTNKTEDQLTFSDNFPTPTGKATLQDTLQTEDDTTTVVTLKLTSTLNLRNHAYSKAIKI